MARKLTSTNALPFDVSERKILNQVIADIYEELDKLNTLKMDADGSNAALPTTNQPSPALWSNSNVVNRGTA